MDKKQQGGKLASTELDFTKPLEASAQAVPSPEQLAATEHEAAAGTAELESKGSYVSIARRSKTLTPIPPGTKYQILLIDDNTEFARVTQKLLDLAGYSVRTASNRGAIAAELTGPTLPDLILLDVALGELNGFDILVRLRQHPRLSAVPVIMLTAHATRKDVMRGLLGGADGYLSKPCLFVTLTHAIRTVLDIR